MHVKELEKKQVASHGYMVMNKTLSGQNGLAETMTKVKLKLKRDYAPATEGMKRSLAESMARAFKMIRSSKC